MKAFLRSHWTVIAPLLYTFVIAETLSQGLVACLLWGAQVMIFYFRGETNGEARGRAEAEADHHYKAGDIVQGELDRKKTTVVWPNTIDVVSALTPNGTGVSIRVDVDAEGGIKLRTNRGKGFDPMCLKRTPATIYETDIEDGHVIIAVAEPEPDQGPV